jgi:hypothetical protein
MKEFLIRHFTSPGFKNRLANLYWPVVKMLLAKPYNALLNKWNEKWYLEQAIQSDFEEVAILPEAEGTSYTTVQNVALKQEDAFKMVQDYLIDHEPQKFGMCVTHSVKNIYRFAARVIFKGKVDFSEHDIYLDRETRAREIDGGMVPSYTLKRIADKGIAITGIVPDPEKESDLKTTRADYPDEVVQPFRLKLIKSHEEYSANRNFEKLWAYLTSTYVKEGVRPFQFSITSYKGWWSSDVPVATGTILGAHSVMGITIPFMYGTKRAFFAFDSSYRLGSKWQIAPGVRIVTEDCWNGLGSDFRPVRFVDAVEAKINPKMPLPISNTKPRLERVPTGALFNMGVSNSGVTALQKALIALGYTIPALAGATSNSTDFGYYGGQTADAIVRWKNDNFGTLRALNPNFAVEGLTFGKECIQFINNQIDVYNARV